MKKISKSNKTAKAGTKTKQIDCLLSRRPINFGERLWLWLFYPAFVLNGEGSLAGVKVRMYYEPIMDGGYIYVQRLDIWIAAVIYAARLIWMKIRRSSGPTRLPEDGKGFDPHDRWEFKAVIYGKEELLFYPTAPFSFDCAIGLTVWFWISIFRQPEIWKKHERFPDLYRTLFEERKKGLLRWYARKYKKNAISDQQANDETESFISIPDLMQWKEELGRGIPIQQLSPPNYAFN